ncbi:MAG: 4-alpha-glucanotransferase [Firmicutes bacterium]|nr:4-alpha-glucanotransferase [Bacillota bacterium]
MNKAAGILLPIFSLPSKYGIGTLGKEAFEFVDFLKETNQKYWQVLPLGQTSYGDSPYQSPSVFAGNPYFIDLDILKEEGLVSAKELKPLERESNYVDYGWLWETRYIIFESAFKHFQKKPQNEFTKFKKENKFWLEDYSLFMAVKQKNNYVSMLEWSDDDKNYKKQKKNKTEHKDLMEFYSFLQFLFFTQWRAVKKYANDNGILIIGDRPIYSSLDSHEVWATPEYFQVGKDLTPTAVAGCPPDAFSDDGQLWGNPLYNWEYLKEKNFNFWLESLEFNLTMFDILRIDHFRGFVAYWSIPAGHETARYGSWVEAPFYELFTLIKEKFDSSRIIAEDLGVIDQPVVDAMNFCGYPGMKILQFAFGGNEDNIHLPHNFSENTILYTGTHDSKTTQEWLDTEPEDEQWRAFQYMQKQNEESGCRAFIRCAMFSHANVVIIPMQDYLEVGGEGRINLPSTLGTNWKWRLGENYKTKELVEYAKGLAEFRPK